MICHIFPDTIKIRLSNKQYDVVYHHVEDEDDMKVHIHHKYPNSDGGWIHYRVTFDEQVYDVKTLKNERCL